MECKVNKKGENEMKKALLLIGLLSLSVNTLALKLTFYIMKPSLYENTIMDNKKSIFNR